MKQVITITHEYGSGGRQVGKLLAEELGLEFYDKDLIALTAKKSGFAEEFVRQSSEKKTQSLLYGLYMTSLPVSDQLYLAQSQVIRDLSDAGNCVIVGGCGNYVLRENKNAAHVFIRADFERRMARVRDEYKETGDDARAFLTKQDKKRAAYYNYFTQNKWAYAENFHICVDSGIGLEQTARLLAEYVKLT